MGDKKSVTDMRKEEMRIFEMNAVILFDDSLHEIGKLQLEGILCEVCF